MPISNELNCGESGLSVRMFSSIAAISSNPIIINGSGSLLTRPMGFFESIFPQLNVSISSNHGKLPMKSKALLFQKQLRLMVH